MTSIKWIKDKKPTMKELQDEVGGFTELLSLKDGSQMIMDEEGTLKNKPLNYTASLMAGRMIVGDVVILSEKGLLN
jgi:hypothetical protein